MTCHCLKKVEVNLGLHPDLAVQVARTQWESALAHRTNHLNLETPTKLWPLINLALCISDADVFPRAHDGSCGLATTLGVDARLYSNTPSITFLLIFDLLLLVHFNFRFLA